MFPVWVAEQSGSCWEVGVVATERLFLKKQDQCTQVYDTIKEKIETWKNIYIGNYFINIYYTFIMLMLLHMLPVRENSETNNL